MKQLNQYINEIFGLDVYPKLIPDQRLQDLPMFINEAYNLQIIKLFNHQLVLVQPQYIEFSILQIEKHIAQLKSRFIEKIVLVLNDITAYERRKLIEKGINFIVPGKQLFLPDLLIDLRESFTNPRTKIESEKLLPSAQFIVIYHIIHRYYSWKIEEHSFKEIAGKLGYTAMAISKAIKNLKYHDVIDVIGDKEKFIRFKYDRQELWQILENQNLLVNPVLKRIYTDNLPNNAFMLYTNTSALHEYSDLNPSNQIFYAVDKTLYYRSIKNKTFIGTEQNEGKYCIEIWKYAPEALVEEMPNDAPVVDPLSLYLSLKNSNDERIEMALDQIIENFIW